MASLDVNTTGSTVGDNYRVVWTVTSATDMPEEVFLHKFSSRALERVIQIGDLNWPTTPTQGQAYYRASSADETYSTLDDAEDAKTEVDAALTTLVAAYNDGLATFISSTTTTYS